MPSDNDASFGSTEDPAATEPALQDTLYDILDRLSEVQESLREVQSGTGVLGGREGVHRTPRIDEDDIQPDETEGVGLATFLLPNGNELRFLGVPALDELMVGEITDCGAEQFLVDSSLHPVELFRRVSPERSPVPRLLHRMDRADLLAGREVVETLGEVVEVPADRIGAEIASQATNAGSCQAGEAGAKYFRDHHCDTLGGPGYGKSESYCYSDSWTSVQKTSASRRRATYARMASCGSGPNRMRHFYGTVSGYNTQLSVYVDPQKVARYWSYKKGRARFRRVRMESVSPGGWVRGWIKYHSEIAGGW